VNDVVNSPLENEIQALVDGRLDPARRVEVEAWLAAHPDEAARVRDMSAQRAAVEDAFSGLLDRPVPARLRSAVEGRVQTAPVWRMAAMVALVVVGAAGGWFANETLTAHTSATAMLTNDALRAHSLFVREKRHAVEVTAQEEAHLVTWLSRRLQAELVAPNLENEGYRLVGGRILPASDAGPAAQFMYETPDGERVTLYIEQDTVGREVGFRFTEHDGLSAFWWKDGPLVYVLTGAAPREELLGLARATKAQFAS